MATLIQDLRYGLRMLAKNPGFTAVAIITLALGIGANTAIFSVVNAVMLRNLPVKNPHQLVLFADSLRESMSIDQPTPSEPYSIQSGQWTLFSYPLYLSLRDHSRLFQGICAFQTPEDTLTVRIEGLEQGGAVQVAQGKLVSGNFFSVLGVNAVIGRTLTPADDQPNAAPVAVVSFNYWRNNLGGNPAIVGRTVAVDGIWMTLVGVMPSGFFGVRMKADSEDFWMPLSLRPRLPLTVMPEAKDLLTNPNAYWLNMMGRLKPGVSLLQASAEVDGGLRQYLTAWVGSRLTASERHQIRHAYISLTPGGRGLSQMRFEYAEPLRILLAVVALVLFIACANVANLLLSRATARQKEMAMRLALGATRGRLIQQMLAESVVLSVAGGVLGALLASWGVSILASLVAAKTPLNAKPDFIVLGFIVAVSLLAAVLSGLIPAFRSTRAELVPVLKTGSALAAGQPSKLGVGRSLVVFQISISLLLLIGAGLLLRSLANLEAQDLGFSPEHVLLVSVNPELAGYKSKQLPDLYRGLLDRIRALPGVRSASVGMTSPMSGSDASADVSVEGQPQRRGQGGTQFVAVGPQYFETEGMRIVAGRGISLRDTAASPPITVVNRAFTRQFLLKDKIVGKRLSLGSEFKAPGFEIVGVVEDAKYASAREPANPIFFVSAYQSAYQMESILTYVNEIEIRTADRPTSLAAEVRRAIHEVDSNLPITEMTTLTKQVNDSLGQQQAISELTSFFSVLGLVLACVGLYGIMAYNVARRTNEIGIRMALGAVERDVLKMVVRQGATLVSIGIVAGLVAALALTRLMSGLLYGVKPTDPLTFIAVSVALTGVALAACYIPARRATKVDPMVALRYE